MRRPSLKGLSLLFVLCANIRLTAQNIESIGKEKTISLACGLSFDQILYSARGIKSRRDLYRYLASGNMTSLRGIHFSAESPRGAGDSAGTEINS